MIGVHSRTAQSIPDLDCLLEEQWRPHQIWHSAAGISSVASWGRKLSSLPARAYASVKKLPFCTLEEGFVATVLVSGRVCPCSIIKDDIGIYYDARYPSLLEELIKIHSDDHVAIHRGLDIIDLWKKNNITKYNNAYSEGWNWKKPYVIVVDQTANDASIRLGSADRRSFERALEAALDVYPDVDVLLKVHPRVITGEKKGNMDLNRARQHDRVHVVGDNVHPSTILESAEAVFCVTSQFGFEALLWGKTVHTFGMPFYAGWGLTTDHLERPSRRKNAPIAAVAYSTFEKYTRYRHPLLGGRSTFQEIADYIGQENQTV